jgi:hypothetical protein
MTSRAAVTPVNLPLRRIATALGWLCVITTLALLSPGVVLTAHGEEAPESAPSCSPGEAPEASLMELNQIVEDVRARAAQLPAQEGDGIVVLNNRGYFYGPDAGVPAPDREAPSR